MILHEFGHLLGFDERYASYVLSDGSRVALEIAGCETDFMGNGSQRKEFMAFHSVDILDTALKIAQGASGSYITETCKVQDIKIIHYDNGVGVSETETSSQFRFDNTNKGNDVSDIENKNTRVVEN